MELLRSKKKSFSYRDLLYKALIFVGTVGVHCLLPAT